MTVYRAHPLDSDLEVSHLFGIDSRD